MSRRQSALAITVQTTGGCEETRPRTGRTVPRRVLAARSLMRAASSSRALRLIQHLYPWARLTSDGETALSLDKGQTYVRCQLT